MNYKPDSVYYNTPLATDGNYLDFWQAPEVTPTLDDEIFKITAKYHLRPDLLAFDLYGKSSYWWVFALRNPNSIKDPIGDFQAGLQIFLPQRQNFSKI